MQDDATTWTCSYRAVIERQLIRRGCKNEQALEQALNGWDSLTNELRDSVRHYKHILLLANDERDEAGRQRDEAIEQRNEVLRQFGSLSCEKLKFRREIERLVKSNKLLGQVCLVVIPSEYCIASPPAQFAAQVIVLVLKSPLLIDNIWLAESWTFRCLLLPYLGGQSFI